MMNGPITPATTPPLSSPIEPTASCLPRKSSLASVRSVFALSICTAPASNEKNSSLAVRCPHCHESVAVPDLAGLVHQNVPARIPTKDGEPAQAETPYAAGRGNLKLQTSGVGSDGVRNCDVGSATSSLMKILQEINSELQTHCCDLRQIQLMNPSPAPSRCGSIYSLPLSSEAQLSASSISINPSNADPMKPDNKFQPRRYGFQSGHPLISDLGDLVNLSNANFRLLKTLQDKVNKVDQAEKMLRTERESVERERSLLKQMGAEVEKERVRLMAGGLGLGWENYQMDSSRTQSALTMSRSRSGGVTPDGVLDDQADVVVFDDEWTQEKEQHLIYLEKKLKKANRKWSDEQEEILEPLERLREEKRQEGKAKKFERQTSTKVESINPQEDKSEKSLRKKSSDTTDKTSPRPSSFKNSLSNIRRKSSISSTVRRDSSPTGTSPKIFKRWFP